MSRGQVSLREEGRLGFIQSALTAFALLIRRGFSVVSSEPTRLVFESSAVFVNVYHGRLSYQVGLELGLVGEAHQKYSLHEVLSALAPSELEKARYQTSDQAVLARCLVGVAEVLERAGSFLLSGDASAFDALGKSVAPRRKAVTLQAQFGAILAKADRAWEAKDFDLARDLYLRSKDVLDGSRQRRLEYLMAKLGRTTP